MASSVRDGTNRPQGRPHRRQNYEGDLGMQAKRARNGCGLAVALLSVLIALPASAQISGFTATKNAGNSADELSAGLFSSYERTSVITFSTSSGIVARARYAAAVGTDTGLLTSRTETLNADY